jgi:SNF2 family DNA or RNA helicase
MINIRESRHQRLGGTNSLFIQFDYDLDIVNIIKSCGTYNYDANTHEWEVPVNRLSFILDNLTYFDDINVFLDVKSTNTNPQLKTSRMSFKTPLFEHQLEAVNYGLNTDKWLLLDAPGLGKSLSMIALAEELKEQGKLEHCLIICGINTLKTNWEKEIKKHSNLDAIVIGKKINSKGTVSYSSIKKRAEQLMNPIKEFFVIINIESLRDLDIISAINNSDNKFDMMVFDECHKAKGWSSKQGENLLKLSSKYMVAMTGTLLMNNPLDAYVPLAWIGVEKKRNVTNFKKTYCVFDEMTRGKIVGFKNLDLLKDEIEECSLRRTKDLLKDLPSKNIIIEYIDMEDNHQKFYNAVKDGVKSECDKINLKSKNLLALTTRLRQATSCPSLLTSQSITSSKIERCIDLVDEIVSNGDKVVIFSNFKEPLYQLKELLSRYKPLMGTGDMKEEDVSKNVDSFQADDEHYVFLGTTQKMGTGITLTRANYAIFIDSCWTSALQEQCEDRVHRIGSEKPVFIYRLICKDTIDEAVEAIITRKGTLSKFIIDDDLDEGALDILKRFILDM